jgi:hypothetical protein
MGVWTLTLVDHARRELELLGEFESSPAYAQSIVAAVAAFATYGHSGGSAAVGREHLTALLGYRALSPLTSNPDEWEDRIDFLPAAKAGGFQRSPAGVPGSQQTARKENLRV